MPTEVADVLRALPFPLAMTSGVEHVLDLITPAARRMLGVTPVLGRPLRESAGLDPALLPALDRAHGTGEPARARVLGDRVVVTCVPVRADGAVVGVVLHAEPAVDGVPTVDAEQARAWNVALQHLAEQLSGAATPSAIGALAVTAAVELLQADGAGVYATVAPGVLEVLHAAGWPAGTAERYRRLTLVRGRPLSDAVLDGEAVWLENAEQWHVRYPEMAPVGTSQGFHASACLPLRVEDRDLGGIVFSFSRPRTFTPHERGHLLAVAALCAQALDRARLLVAERAARAEAERQLSRMTFLAQAARLMEAPHSVEERLQRLADLAVSGVADWCAVHLVGAGRVDRVAVAHSDPAKLAFVARLEERYPPDPDAPGGAITVSRTGVPIHYPLVPDELLVAAAKDEEHLALIRSLGMRSAVVVPLLVRGTNLGALTLVQAESGELFTEDDLAYAQQLASTAAVALDNARLYERQQRTASTLQSALLPAALPDTPGLDVAARYLAQSADRREVYVGGDLYDVVAAPVAGRWAVTVADVCGKGAEAAALTAMIRHTVRAEVGHGLSAADVLHRLNDAMVRDTAADPGRFATAVHAHLDVGPDGVVVRLACAGHVPALTVRAGRVEAVGDAGTLLGIYPDVAPAEAVVHLRPGDLLVLYTDGVTEARGMQGWYGSERLHAVLAGQGGRGADEVADAVVTDVTAFQDGPARDDVALLVVRVGARR